MSRLPNHVTVEVTQEFEQIPAPDHEHDSSWVVRGSATDLTGPVVFLVHATTASGGWFGDPHEAGSRAAVDAATLSQLDAFPGVVWAPRYRQASTRAFHERDSGGELAYDLAQQDVARAFSQFLADDARRPGPPRPVVLVGHSQGARHVRALVEEFFDHEGLAARLVAAYVVGVSVPADDALLRRFPVATAPDQCGVVVTYQARLGTPEKQDAGPGGASPTVGECVGAAALGADTLGARTERGYLVVPRAEIGELAAQALPDGRLHHVEVEALAGVLAADVRRRTRSWRMAQPTYEDGVAPTRQPDELTVVPVDTDLAVEAWPGARGRTYAMAEGLAHVVDLPGPTEGALPPVVLLHKLGGWVAEWRGVAERLATRRRVLVVDLPGHGGSAQCAPAPWIHWPEDSATEVHRLLQHLETGRVHLMGCSLGGVVATSIAARHPGQVLSLTLLGSSLTAPLGAARTLEIDRSVRPGFGAGWVPRPGQNGRSGTDDPAVLADQDASRARAGTWVRPSERGVGLSGVDHVLRQVEAPVMYLNGENAGYRVYESKVLDLVEDVRVRVVAGAGSFVHQERPAEVVELWNEFVGGLEVQTTP